MNKDEEIIMLNKCLDTHNRLLCQSAQNEVKLNAALNRAVDKIHNFEGHKRTVESIRNELMGGDKS